MRVLDLFLGFSAVCLASYARIGPVARWVHRESSPEGPSNGKRAIDPRSCMPEWGSYCQYQCQGAACYAQPVPPFAWQGGYPPQPPPYDGNRQSSAQWPTASFDPNTLASPRTISVTFAASHKGVVVIQTQCPAARASSTTPPCQPTTTTVTRPATTYTQSQCTATYTQSRCTATTTANQWLGATITVTVTQGGGTVTSTRTLTQGGATYTSTVTQPGGTVTSTVTQQGGTVTSTVTQPAGTTTVTQPGRTVTQQGWTVTYTVTSTYTQPGATVTSTYTQPGTTVTSTVTQSARMPTTSTVSHIGGGLITVLVTLGNGATCPPLPAASALLQLGG